MNFKIPVIHNSKCSRQRHATSRSTTLLAVASLALAACGSSTSSSATKTTAQSGIAYFKGKTITFIAPDAPGGQDDAIMRIAAAGMGKYLHCNVKVSNVPQGNTMPGQDEAAASSPNGLTIGYLNLGSDLDAKLKGKPGVNFNIDAVKFLGSTPAPLNVMVSSPSSPYKTIEDVLNSTSTVNILEPTSGSATFSIGILIAAYKANAKIVTGYANAAALVQGLIRGDGPVTDTAEKVLISAISSGKALPILQMGPADTNPASPIHNQLKNVPTLQQLYKKLPPKTASGKQTLQALITYRTVPQQWLFVPSKTPASVVATLQAAMKATFTGSTATKQLEKQGLTIGYVSGKVGLKDVKLMQSAIPIIEKFQKG